MPTAEQLALYRKLERMFGHTAEWRRVTHTDDITCMDGRTAYTFLKAIMVAVDDLTFARLPRSAGLPQNDEERRELYRRAAEEERHARRACIEVLEDEERETWSADTRPPAMGNERSYLEIQDELQESIEMDRGWFRPIIPAHLLPSHLVVQ